MARKKTNKQIKKRLYTLDDLYNFFLTKNATCNFNSEETGYQLSVQIPAQFEVSDDVEDDTLLFCTVKLMHSGENRNHSSVTDEALVKASKHLAYKPILANFMEYTDKKTGETLKDFTSHDMKINDDGTVTYFEKQVGCFTSDEPYFEVEEETGHNFLYGICAIPREYTDTVSIIERKNGTKVSVELAVNEMSFNATSKVLELTDVVILGATLLGKDPETLKDVGEGMKNARLDIADFSTKNNSVFTDYENQMIEFQERLEKLETACFNKDQNLGQNNEKEGGNETNMFEKLLEKYGKTVEDITFDYAELSDEELEAKFAEMFEEAETGTDGSGDEPSTDGEGDGTADPEADTNTDDDGEGSDDGEGDNSDDGEGNEQFEKLVRTFEISHEDTRYALYVLLSEFEEADNEWYFINAVYDTYFTYENWSGDKIYGQAYTKDGDNVTFDGERYNLHRELLTDSEYAELQSMRSNYAALKEFKENVEKNELTTQKNELINSDKYAVIAEKDEEGNYTNEVFAKLVSEMDNYSLDELETQIKIVHSDFMAENSNFSAKTEKKMGSVKVATMSSNKKTGRYGDLFKK